jgi:hypothetical protein
MNQEDSIEVDVSSVPHSFALSALVVLVHEEVWFCTMVVILHSLNLAAIIFRTVMQSRPAIQYTLLHNLSISRAT